MNRQDEYMTNNFTWFIGEVLDINDTILYARVKVRAYGYYDESVPKEKLPWATVLLPNTSASKEGVGSTHGLLVGSWVVGFFRDGPSAQDPIIMGVINGSEKPKRAGPNIKRHLFTSGAQITVNNNTGVIELSGSNAGKVRIL